MKVNLIEFGGYAVATFINDEEDTVYIPDPMSNNLFEFQEKNINPINLEDKGKLIPVESRGTHEQVINFSKYYDLPSKKVAHVRFHHQINAHKSLDSNWLTVHLS